jgi:hypothetical protein
VLEVYCNESDSMIGSHPLPTRLQPPAVRKNSRSSAEDSRSRLLRGNGSRNGSVDATLIAGAESVSHPGVFATGGIAIEKIERSVPRHGVVVGDGIVGRGGAL